MMRTVYFNVLYEDDVDDVDIISVPYHIATRMSVLTQEFLDWLPNAVDDIYWTMIDGRKCSVCETEGFVKWLNENYCENNQMVTIVKEHTQYVREYSSVEF